MSEFLISIEFKSFYPDNTNKIRNDFKINIIVVDSIIITKYSSPF